ncbi:hypothetical protein TNCV_5093611 [Trichonephila clavipes]|nr:hypothetical protein TNCV_5093611 [Trichonephila clavipes]
MHILGFSKGGFPKMSRAVDWSIAISLMPTPAIKQHEDGPRNYEPRSSDEDLVLSSLWYPPSPRLRIIFTSHDKAARCYW